ASARSTRPASRRVLASMWLASGFPMEPSQANATSAVRREAKRAGARVMAALYRVRARVRSPRGRDTLALEMTLRWLALSWLVLSACGASAPPPALVEAPAAVAPDRCAGPDALREEQGALRVYDYPV